MGFHTATRDELTIEPGLGDRGVLSGHASLQSASPAPGAGDGLGENGILLRFLFLLWGSRVPDSPRSPAPPCNQHGPRAAPLSAHPPPCIPSLPSLPPPRSLSSWAKALVEGAATAGRGSHWNGGQDACGGGHPQVWASRPRCLGQFRVPHSNGRSVKQCGRRWGAPGGGGGPLPCPHPPMPPSPAPILGGSTLSLTDVLPVTLIILVGALGSVLFADEETEANPSALSQPISSSVKRNGKSHVLNS